MEADIPKLLLLTVLCAHIGVVWSHEDCGEKQYFCTSTSSCIPKTIPCDGKCPDDRPNFCDNRTFCYPDSYINDRFYDCADRSDEHRPEEETPPLNNSSVTKFLQLKAGQDTDGDPGLNCEDGTVHSYKRWCKEGYERMCAGISTTDYFICTNSSVWMDRPCGEGWVRGLCKVPGKCIDDEWKCNGRVGASYSECGANDYSDEFCQVNEEKMKAFSRYFNCKDNSALIHPTLICDGYKHCEDASDENECGNCPRINDMVIHDQVVKLKAEEIRDLAHLKNTAIMQCVSPYGQAICATPGDGVPECIRELNEGLWETQDEVELTPAKLWRTIFKYMSYIFLISVVVLFKISQLGYLCQKSTGDIPILTSYRKTITLDDGPLPLAISKRSLTTAGCFFPTPFFTTTKPMQLNQKFKQFYIKNHSSKYFAEFFNFCLTLSQFLPTGTDRDIFHCGIYALEAQIHSMSPTCTDQCLKQHSSAALEPLFDAVYGCLSDRFPIGVKNFLHRKNTLPCLHYFLRMKTFLFRYFFFYFDIVQEFVLLSSILGTAGLGISTTYWLEMSDFNYIHIMIYLYVSSVFLPTILFAIQLSYSSQIGIVFGVEHPSFRQRLFFGFCCFILSPFIPTVLFFRMEKKQMKIFKYASNAGKVLDRLNKDNVSNVDLLSLKHEIVETSIVLMDTNAEIIEAKSLYKQFKEWELAIEMPIQSSLATIFSFMKKSTTVVNQVFQNWFISDAANLVLLICLSLRSIIAVQISDESARRNNFLGMKSKMFLAPLYMMTSISKIASIVLYVAVPLGLMDLLGHWTVEKQGMGYHFYGDHINESHLMDCIEERGYNITENRFHSFYSTLFSADVNYTKYTVWDTTTYAEILMAVLATSVIINFVWLCLKSKKSLNEKILSSFKSLLCITLHSDFDEDDENVRLDNFNYHYRNKFLYIHKEYIFKLLLHTGTNMALTFPWVLAYQGANGRQQILMAIGECYGVSGTVLMEDKSLSHLWWGHWALPLMMAANGVLNYVWFRLYVKYGHPWRRLLTSDSERIKEWKTLKLWEMLENQNDHGEEAVNSSNLNMRVNVVIAGRDVWVNEDVTANKEDYSSNSKEEFQEKKLKMVDEAGDNEAVTVGVDSSIILKVYTCMDVLMERENIQFEKESATGKREDRHKQELQSEKVIEENLCEDEKDNNRTKVEEIIEENISMKSDFCVETICVDRDKDKDNLDEELKERDKNKMSSVVDLWLGDDERDKENQIVKQNVSKGNYLCAKNIYDGRHHENEIQTQNLSSEKNLSKEQSNNDKDKVMMGIENLSIPRAFHVDDDREWSTKTYL